MFICQVCRRTPKEHSTASPVKIVTKTRSRFYVYDRRGAEMLPERGTYGSLEDVPSELWDEIDESKTSSGWEIVQEKDACAACAADHKRRQEEAAAELKRREPFYAAVAALREDQEETFSTRIEERLGMR